MKWFDLSHSIVDAMPVYPGDARPRCQRPACRPGPASHARPAGDRHQACGACCRGTGNASGPRQTGDAGQGRGPRGTGGQAGWPGRCRASARRAGQQACHAGGTGQTRRAGPSGNGQLNALCRNRELA